MKKFLFIFLSFWAVNVKADNKVTINLDKPSNYESSIFNVYYSDIAKLEKITVVDTYELYVDDGIRNIVITETECDPHYELTGKSYYIDFSVDKDPIINVSHKIKYIDVNLKLVYYDLINNAELMEFDAMLEFYKDNNELILTTIDKKVSIPADNYIIKDTLNNKCYELSLFNNEEIVIKELVINGFVGDNIKSICDENKCYNFEKENYIYLFQEYILPGNYKINDQNYVLDNTSIIDGKNIVTIDIKEELPEIREDDIVNEDNPIKDLIIEEEIIVDVPNTGQIYNDNLIYYVEKKYYYY